MSQPVEVIPPLDDIRPPWTPEQVAALNAFQRNPQWHPFTCANGRDERHPDREGVLVATPDGWTCPHCPYTQGWAHSFMAKVGGEVDEWFATLLKRCEQNRENP